MDAKNYEITIKRLTEDVKSWFSTNYLARLVSLPRTISRTISAKVTPQMRKFAWAMAYSLAGNKPLNKDIPAEAQKWKGLALTKKKNITIHANIPKRQFMGESLELNKKIESTIEKELSKLIK